MLRLALVASLDSPYVCHGFGHVARSDVYSADAGGCLGLGDHEYFDAVKLDAKCREAAP